MATSWKPAEKEAIEAAAKDLEEALKGEDKEAIEAKTTALMTASQKLGEKVYAEAQAAAAAGGAEAAPKLRRHSPSPQAPAMTTSSTRKSRK